MADMKITEILQVDFENDGNRIIFIIDFVKIFGS
jgi:hypothetical protein